MSQEEKVMGNLHPYYIEVETERNWKSKSKIMGQATENYVKENIYCPVCDKRSDLNSYPINTKSKNFRCKNKDCRKRFQVQALKVNERKFKKIQKTREIKTMGGDYRTTIKNLKEEIDYIIILYEERNLYIYDIIHISSDTINESNIIPRSPLSPKAKRAGWQGCFLYFKDIHMTFTIIV